MFLAVMSVALLGAVQSKDPLKYKTSFDIFRLVCEILTLIFVGIYFFIEIDQLEKYVNSFHIRLSFLAQRPCLLLS